MQHLRRMALVLLGSMLVCSIHAAEIRVHYDTGWGNWIALRGDGAGLNWSSGVATTWTSGNIWVLQTPPEQGGFSFKPLFNDQFWSTGANYQVPDGNSVVDIYPFFGAAQGQLQIFPNFYSSILDRSRSLRIYLPPSYDENEAKHYPVVYLHDGQNMFQAATSAFGTEWEVDETADSLVAQGKIREVIFVGMDNTGAHRIEEYTPTDDPDYGGGNGDDYLDFITNEAMPWVQANFRTLNGPENTLIMGSSLGGLISFYAAWTRPHVFGTGVCMSSSFWWDGDGLVEQVEAYSGPWIDARFYMDIGGGESSIAQTNRMRDALENLGYIHQQNLWHYYDPNGAHNEASWQNRLHIPLEATIPWQ